MVEQDPDAPADTLERALGRVPSEKVTVEILEGPRDLARLSTLSEEEIKQLIAEAEQKASRLARPSATRARLPSCVMVMPTGEMSSARSPLTSPSKV